MGWVDIAWPMMGAVCLTLGVIHLLVWLRARANRAHLAFFFAAVSVAGLSVVELQSFHAADLADFATALRWAQVPIAALAASLVAVVHYYIGCDRLWLGVAAVVVRLVSLGANFTTGANVQFQSIDALRPVEFLGASFPVPVGPANPWMLVLLASNLLFLAYVIDAILAAWRRQDRDLRRRAAVVGGSIVAFVTTTSVLVFLVTRGLFDVPMAGSTWFTVIVVAMGYELSADVFRAARLADRLRASEAQAREAEQRLQLAVGAADVGLWSWDPAQDRIWATGRTKALFGAPPADDTSLDTFLGGVQTQDRVRTRAAIEACARGAGDLEVEFQVPVAEGPPRWIIARGRLEPGGSGASPLVSGASLDVTAQHEAAQQRDELAHLSRVSLLGEMSGSLAHELNQPLMAILSNAQAALRFMERDPVDMEELRSILSDIVDNDRRAGEVIRRLRSMLKKEPADHRVLSLNDIVRDVMKLMHSDLLNRDVVVRLELARAPPPTVLGDRIQLQQVLLNLVVNATDAMAGATRDREITLGTAAGDGREREFWVTDRGPGIAEDQLERVFEPFVTTKSEGMGLGLAVCRTIVLAHGGRVWATRNTGPGATFHVALPALAGAG